MTVQLKLLVVTDSKTNEMFCISREDEIIDFVKEHFDLYTTDEAYDIERHHRGW